MIVQREVRSFLERWAAAMERRQLEQCADLFLRDPAPIVVFSDGERAQDWLDVRIRIGRDFERAIVDRVEIHELVVRELSETVVLANFEYDLTVRDPWGTSGHVTRHTTMTLVMTKDGWRIGSAHFSAAR